MPPSPSPATASAAAPPPGSTPASTATATPCRLTRTYKITDNMHTLPAGLWDTTVSFTAEITDLEDGLEWVVRAPLGLVQTNYWRIVDAEEQDKAKEPATKLVVVEEVEIRASGLLVGTVRGKCESNWPGVHGRFLGHLERLIREEVEVAA